MSNNQGILIVPTDGSNVKYIRVRRDPTTVDRGYPASCLWINTLANKVWIHYGYGIWDQVFTSQTEVSDTNVDTGTETVDSFLDTVGRGVVWEYVVDKGPGTNMRKGRIESVWNGTADFIPTFNENSTADIGNTSGVSFVVDKSGNTVRLRCTVTSNNWTVYAVRTLIG